MNPPEKIKMTLEHGKVKNVISGDTLVVTFLGNPKLERTLSLAYVTAPRIRREGDEPFAFESRDFIRRLVVGKVLQFHVLYSVPTGAKRDYINAWTQTGQSLPEYATAEGWVKVRDDCGSRGTEQEGAEELADELPRLQAKAKASSKGLWAGGDRLQTSLEVSDAKGFVGEWKGKSLNGIVEKVLTGDRMIVRLLLSPTRHIQTLLLVAGIRTPSTKRTNVTDGKEVPGEPFGEEAFEFIDEKMLQRNVVVDIVGQSNTGQLIATIKHPANGNIAPFLLEAGLARCHDHHSTMLGGEMAALRAAEKKAKEKNLGVFRGQVVKRSAGVDIESVVTRVQSADTIYVSSRSQSGAEKRVSLSSIRAPKTTDPKQSQYIADAKEFLRKKLIGKHVKVAVDGKKAASDGFEEKEVVTVTMHGGKNAALVVVEAGYASVIRHRRDDDDRSPAYDDLIAAEEVAIKEKIGMWSGAQPVAKHYQDYSENVQKAKVQSSVLSRQKKVPAVVDFVKSGSRFVILIPRENAKLTFVLSGIRAPRSARNPTEIGEPFGQECHDFANRRCMQRDVEINVEGTDKVGGFIGTLFVNHENFTKLLVEEGLATVHAYSAEQSGSAAELFAAEKKAKDGRKGMWHDWDPNKDAEDGEGEEDAPPNGTTNGTTNGSSSAPAPPRKLDYRDIMVTHIDPESLQLKLQMIGTGTSALQTMMTSFRALQTSNSAPPSLTKTPPKAGDFVAAKFSEDGEWYRARVRRNDRDGKASEVVYVDYGNEEKVAWSSLRTLGSQFGIATLKAQATNAILSFITFPTSKEYVSDAIGYLAERTADKRLVANVDSTSPEGTLYVTLLDKDSEGVHDSINKDVVNEGLSMAQKKLTKGWEKAVEGGKVMEALKRAEEEAKEERRGMWEYGDLTED